MDQCTQLIFSKQGEYFFVLLYIFFNLKKILFFFCMVHLSWWSRKPDKTGVPKKNPNQITNNEECIVSFGRSPPCSPWLKFSCEASHVHMTNDPRKMQSLHLLFWWHSTYSGMHNPLPHLTKNIDKNPEGKHGHRGHGGASPTVHSKDVLLLANMWPLTSREGQKSSWQKLMVKFCLFT